MISSRIARTRGLAARWGAVLLCACLAGSSTAAQIASVSTIGSVAAPLGGAAASASGASSVRVAPFQAASLTASPLASPMFLSAARGAPSLAAAAGLEKASEPARAAALEGTGSPLTSAAADASKAPAGAPSAAPAEAAPLPIETGPRTAGIDSRISRRFAELKRFFAGRRDAGTAAATPASAVESAAPQGAEPRTSGLAAAPSTANDKVSQGADAPPAPAPQEPKKGKKSLSTFFKSLTFPKALWILLGNFVLTQIALEFLGVAGPQLVKDFAQNWIVSGVLSASASLALTFGSLLAPYLNKKLGENKAYLFGLAGRAVGIGVMAKLLANHCLTALGLTAIFSVDYVFYAANSVTEGTLATQHLGNDISKLGSYNAFRQFLTETIGLVCPFAAAAAIVFYGYPVTLMTCFALSALTLIGPIVSSVGRRAPAAAPAASSAATTAAPAAKPAEAADVPQSMSFMDSLRHLWNTPALRAAALAYALFNAFTMTIYFLIGPAYGAFAAPFAHASGVAITAKIYGFIAGGGILGSWLLKRVSAKTAGQADGNASYARKIGTGTAVAALSLLVFWSWLWATPLVALYVTPAIMVLLGMAQQFAINGLMSIVQVVAPDAGKAKTIGLVRAISLAFAAVISIAMGFLFSAGAIANVPVMAAFIGLNVGLTAMAAAGLFLARQLRRSSSTLAARKP